MLRFRCALAALIAVTACQHAFGATATEGGVGRYVIIHSPIVERDTMLLDTVTGRTWQLVEETDLNDGPLAWSPVPQLNTKEDMDALIKKHGFKPTSAAPPSSQ